ncbi:MAG: hypothetical protein VB058_05840 [Oscillospiraceae bacterium]|nr:hypothetical protein [Oscillospiraceae bacterium]
MIRIFERNKKKKAELEVREKADMIILRAGAKAMTSHALLAAAGDGAVKMWGKDKQLWKAAEEMGELTRAISRERCEEVFNVDNIAEEIADVEIMLYQLKQIFDCEAATDKWREKKLVALLRRVGECNNSPQPENASESLQAGKNAETAGIKDCALH